MNRIPTHPALLIAASAERPCHPQHLFCSSWVPQEEKQLGLAGRTTGSQRDRAGSLQESEEETETEEEEESDFDDDVGGVSTMRHSLVGR